MVVFVNASNNLKGVDVFYITFFSFHFLLVFSQLVLAIYYEFIPLDIFYFSRSPSTMKHTNA